MPVTDKYTCIHRLIFMAHWENETPPIFRLLTGRGMQTNAITAKKLGLPANFRKIWSRKMDLIIIENYQTSTNLEMVAMIKKKSIHSQAR